MIVSGQLDVLDDVDAHVVEAVAQRLAQRPVQRVQDGQPEALEAAELDLVGAHAGLAAPDGAARQHGEVDAPEHGQGHGEDGSQDGTPTAWWRGTP